MRQKLESALHWLETALAVASVAVPATRTIVSLVESSKTE